MSNDLLEHAKNILHRAQKLGVQGIQALVTRGRNSSVEWRDGKLDRLREATSMSMNVSLYVDGRYSANSTSDFRPEAMDGFLEETVATTRVLAKDPHRKLPNPDRYKNRYQDDLKIFDSKSASNTTAQQQKQTVKNLEQAARSTPHADQIISVTTERTDFVTETAMLISNGMQAASQATYFLLSAVTSVKDQNDRKPEGDCYAVTHLKNRLPSEQHVGLEATRRALMDVGGKPKKSGQYACVIESRLIRRILGGLLSPLRGNAIQQKRSFLADKLNQQVISTWLSITDDPHHAEGLGSCTFDDEGMSSRKMAVFEQGVLKNFYLDTYYASKLDLTPTTASESNLVFSTGKRNLEELLREMGTGILVTGFSGGNSNSATGDFSIGIRGQWIENGNIAHPVAEMNLAGNHLSFWKQLVELGNDPYPYSSWRCPSLRFDKIQFSGV